MEGASSVGLVEWNEGRSAPGREGARWEMREEEGSRLLPRSSAGWATGGAALEARGAVAEVGARSSSTSRRRWRPRGLVGDGEREEPLLGGAAGRLGG